MALASVCGFKLSNENSYFGEGSDGPMGVPNVKDALDMSTKFTIPCDIQTRANITQSMNDDGANVRIHYNHGTTTLAFIFQHGIMVAVDSRATGGSSIESTRMRKVLELSPYILSTIAGGAADCAFWGRHLAREIRLYELRNRRRITVSATSKMLANIVYEYKGRDLSMGMMIIGWDKDGPKLHYIDSDGNRLKNRLMSVGSGSTYAYGVLDTGYRWDLNLEEAMDLGRRAICAATHRDAYSGGVVNMYHVKETGWERLPTIDTIDLFYMYKEQKEEERQKVCQN